MGDITLLIERARNGDGKALGALFEKLYPELRRIAHSRLRRGFPDPEFGTTALVHECFLKLCDTQRLSASDRQHFMAYVATTMRSIVVDIARNRASARHGGQALHVTLEDDQGGGDTAGEDEILRVHEALQELAELEPRLVQLVELRYFSGLGDTEIAAALDVTDRTVRRDWRKARVLLAAALR